MSSSDQTPNVPRAAWLEQGVPASLYIVAVKTKSTDNIYAFANGKHNEYDSTLILRFNAQIPVRLSNETEPKFVGHQLVIDEFPKMHDRVLVIPIMDRPYLRKFVAKPWTTQKIWDAAHEDYTVLKFAGDSDEPVEKWDFSGVFELSYTFPSAMLDNDGFIYNDGTVKYELVARYIDGEEVYYAEVGQDPRVPLAMLPENYRNRSLLAMTR